MNYRELLIRLVSMTTPFVYDDTLTFLEMVRRFNKIINEVLEVIQGLTNDFDSLQDEVETFDDRITTNTNNIAQNESAIEENAQDIVDLKDYVDNYFDSLNVSIVVRQVLNDMVADGTLEQLLNQTVLAELNADVSSLKTRVTSLETTTTTQGTQITELNTRTQVLESDNITNKQSIIALQSSDSQQNTRLTTNESAISTLTTNVGTNTSDISTLQTSVGAISNDVGDLQIDVATLDANVKNFNLTSFTNIPSSSISSTGNTINPNSFVNVAKNNDGSLAKVYGEIAINSPSSSLVNIVIVGSGLTPDSDLTINCAGFCRLSSSGQYIPTTCDITIKTNGNIEINKNIGSNVDQVVFWLQPYLYFVKDFGDVPIV